MFNSRIKLLTTLLFYRGNTTHPVFLPKGIPLYFVEGGRSSKMIRGELTLTIMPSHTPLPGVSPQG
jgi:hypothetical protein